MFCCLSLRHDWLVPFVWLIYCSLTVGERPCLNHLITMPSGGYLVSCLRVCCHPGATSSCKRATANDFFISTLSRSRRTNLMYSFHVGQRRTEIVVSLKRKRVSGLFEGKLQRKTLLVNWLSFPLWGVLPVVKCYAFHVLGIAFCTFSIHLCNPAT